MLGPELQIVIVTLIFLGLLTAGITLPFAIAVPAIIRTFLAHVRYLRMTSPTHARP